MLFWLASQILQWLSDHWFQLAVLAGMALIASRLLALQYTIQFTLSTLTYEMRRIVENPGSGLTSVTHHVAQQVEQSAQAVGWKLDEILREIKHSSAGIDGSIQGLRDEIKGTAYALERQLAGLDLNWRR